MAKDTNRRYADALVAAAFVAKTKPLTERRQAAFIERELRRLNPNIKESTRVVRRSQFNTAMDPLVARDIFEITAEALAAEEAGEGRYERILLRLFAERRRRA